MVGIFSTVAHALSAFIWSLGERQKKNYLAEEYLIACQILTSFLLIKDFDLITRLCSEPFEDAPIQFLLQLKFQI